MFGLEVAAGARHRLKEGSRSGGEADRRGESSCRGRLKEGEGGG